MRLTSLFCAVLASASAAATAGCGASGHAVVVADYDAPPAPRQEYTQYRAGYVWIEGHWMRDGDRWRWQSGYFERERPGYVYAPGRWVRQGSRYIWVDGRWRMQNTVVIRGRGRF